MEAKKKEKGKEYTCRKEITIFRTEIRKKKGSKKKVRKIQQKILPVQSEVKKNIGLSIRRGGDSGFLVYSNTPPTPNQWPFPLIETTPTNNPPSSSKSVVMHHRCGERNLRWDNNPGLLRTEPQTHTN